MENIKQLNDSFTYGVYAITTDKTVAIVDTATRVDTTWYLFSLNNNSETNKYLRDDETGYGYFAINLLRNDVPNELVHTCGYYHSSSVDKLKYCHQIELSDAIINVLNEDYSLGYIICKYICRRELNNNAVFFGELETCHYYGNGKPLEYNKYKETK